MLVNHTSFDPAAALGDGHQSLEMFGQRVEIDGYYIYCVYYILYDRKSYIRNSFMTQFINCSFRTNSHMALPK